jgi:AmmeMemoRadiSam system protein A
MTDSSCTVNLSGDERATLLAVASDSIAHGLRLGKPLPVNVDDYSATLGALRATFVTLQIDERLRGCIGMLEAVRPMVTDVSQNAYAAAFGDPRFAPVNAAEQQQLEIHISILSPPEPMSFTSQDDLCSQVRPGTDGLILQDGRRRGTFLPAVWESLPEVGEFMAHLKAKAGLPTDYWSDSIEVWRYTSESVP